MLESVIGLRLECCVSIFPDQYNLPLLARALSYHTLTVLATLIVIFSFQCDTVYPQRFLDYDIDKDKKITLEELSEATKCTKGEMSTDFDETDKNGKF